MQSKKHAMPNLLVTNVRSIIDKTDELECVLTNNNIDIACITESWLTENIPTEAINIPGYVCYRHDREDGRRGGGVLCYVNTGLSCQVLDQLYDPDIESLWLLCRGTRMPRRVSHIAIGIIYHAPTASSSRATQHILSCLDSISRIHPCAGFILLGDFNQLNDSTIRSYPLKQVVKCATRKSAILDKIYTNIACWYDQPFSMPPIGKSDHNCIVMVSASRCHQYYDHSSYFVYVRSNDNNGKILLSEALRNYNWSTMYRMEKCDDMLNYFNNVVLSLLDYYLPVRVCKRNKADKPWVDDNFRRLIRSRQYAWKHYNMADYRKYRNQVQRTAVNLRKKYYQRHIGKLRDSNPRQWWRDINNITGRSTTQCISTMANNMCNGNVQSLANDINAFLQSVSNDLQPLSVALIPGIAEYFNDYFTIEPFEVERKLSNINVNKSSGPDNIPNWLLRDNSVWLAEPVCAIYNVSIRQGVVPAVWKHANVVPIPKTQPPRVIESDLRPISLTSTLSKVLESFVGCNILETVRDKLDKRQYGALKGRSTTHALMDIIHHWHQALDNNETVRAVFIDYAKAFDHVDHSTVIRKLYDFGVDSVLIRWVCSFLVQRFQRVKLTDCFSKWLPLKGSMPQGTWLGPLIFVLLIDDLSTSCMLHKFVDDLTLTELFKRGESSAMSDHLNTVIEWSKDNLMNVNYKKTKEMLLGAVNGNGIGQLIVDGNTIARVSTFKLLGIHVESNLKWNSHVDYIYAKASSRLYFLKQLKKCSNNIGDMLHFYTTVIRPVLEYACPVWHTSITNEQCIRLESIQRRAIHIINGITEDYTTFCINNNLPSLYERRCEISKRFFNNNVLPSASCLHYLLPNRRDINITVKLRNPSVYCLPTVRTERFKHSFINYAAEHY